jgi:hypothetical protein
MSEHRYVLLRAAADRRKETRPGYEAVDVRDTPTRPTGEPSDRTGAYVSLPPPSPRFVRDAQPPADVDPRDEVRRCRDAVLRADRLRDLRMHRLEDVIRAHDAIASREGNNSSMAHPKKEAKR